MTFILAIQMNDSIVVAADNQEVVLKAEETNNFNQRHTLKLHTWDSGIITGTGESYVISQSMELFKKLAHSDISKLPQCLEISRQIRELGIGTGYVQVEITKLLCSSYSERGAQLYKIERIDDDKSYTMTAMEPMDITVWMFNPNVKTITADLKNLYLDLKDYGSFSNQTEWINYYINRIAPIYQKQSQVDSLMSQSFDIFFQTKDEYVFGHIPNTQNTMIELKEIYSNSDPI
ncbi:hypothetical protein [Acinetobacter indicus]|uniref:hypothetical protein n=1 Tax=Acinetobacter indicus TaxID=756892 RepID=UPI0014402C6F|nr:hypothetical protein [Acinetobacter indicus]MDM1291083.1 hypothetical protein [Acinetobacter indicus]MDM1321190.1 hypothetical protein [Acinetobacter indicus]MDM1333584.1 hypothetical protein [Acinetobacter indicus]QIZ59008.1 hypothetical protein FK537_07690 [Acinetobacter indicus]